jgi:GH15 family glucan-1,4-alpha-glucosidase
MRSLITLKALTYGPTGGIVAAPTTSLPETLGGIRNWDYRFCWLRDATLSLLALMNAGYYEEAGAWRDWLLRAVAGAPAQAQIMYSITGERRLTEWEIDWLPGYEGAKPVRIKRACTPASINTMPTRRTMPTGVSFGSKRAADITANATST